MKILSYLIFLLIPIGLNANDHVVISVGDTIHPVEKTILEIHREDLQIEYDEVSDDWKVNVTFFIYNPSDAHMVQKIAFVNRSIPFQKYEHRIKDFVTKINDESVSFQRFEKYEPSEIWDYVVENYVSDIEFPPGYTKVFHSYRYYGSMGWGPNTRGFYYTLTTANQWNGPIKSFNLEVSLPRNCILHPREPSIKDLIPYGKYVKKEAYFFREKDRKQAGIFIKEGGFFLSRNDYVPDHDLTLEYYDFSWYMKKEELIRNKEIRLIDILSREIAENELYGLSKEELRIVRNAIFAWHGYKFKDKELESYFSNFIWYFPIEGSSIELSKIENANIELIARLERD